MNQSTKIVIVILLVLAGAAVVSFTAGLFSLLGEDVVGPSCEVAPGGGSCDLILELPAGKSLSDGYSFDLATASIVDEEFKDERDVIQVASGGPYLEEDDMTELDYENTYIYLFQVPTEWQNVYQYKVVATSPRAYVRTGGTSGRATLSVHAGFVTVPYPYSSIEVETIDGDNYNEDYSLARNYIDSGGEWYFSSRHQTVQGSVDENEIYVRANSNSYPLNLRKDIVSTYVFSGTAVPDYDAKFIARMEEDNRYYNADFSWTAPTMKASWKEEYFISNLRVTIGDNQFYTKSGKITDTVYLPDMSGIINDYCGRTGLFPRDDECIIKMTMSSTDGGIITVSNELGELKEVGGDFNFNAITGWVTFDVENEPTNAYITMGLILAVVGLIAFLILRGGKKK